MKAGPTREEQCEAAEHPKNLVMLKKMMMLRVIKRRRRTGPRHSTQDIRKEGIRTCARDSGRRGFLFHHAKTRTIDAKAPKAQ